MELLESTNDAKHNIVITIDNFAFFFLSHFDPHPFESIPESPLIYMMLFQLLTLTTADAPSCIYTLVDASIRVSKLATVRPLYRSAELN